MDRRNELAGQFEATGPHVRAMAYRMLGSLREADDAVRNPSSALATPTQAASRVDLAKPYRVFLKEGESLRI